MENKTYPRVQIIINADSNSDIQESIGWLSGAVHQSATEWPSESPAVKVLDEKPKNIEAKGTPPEDIIDEKPTKKTKSEKKVEKPEASKKVGAEKSNTISLDDLRKKMSAVLKSGKRDEAKALLAEFEAPKLGELSEDKYSDFNKGLDALLGGD